MSILWNYCCMELSLESADLEWKYIEETRNSYCLSISLWANPWSWVGKGACRVRTIFIVIVDQRSQCFIVLAQQVLFHKQTSTSFCASDRKQISPEERCWCYAAWQEVKRVCSIARSKYPSTIPSPTPHPNTSALLPPKQHQKEEVRGDEQEFQEFAWHFFLCPSTILL